MTRFNDRDSAARYAVYPMDGGFGMKGAVMIELDDLDEIRQALMAAHHYVNAIDLAESQKMLMPETRESSLAKMVRHSVETTEEYINAYLRERYDAGDLDEANAGE
jgi:hypothetical protein